jgi:hypothetical protein
MVVYDRRAMVLAALLVGLVLVLAALVFVVVRGVGLWRTAKRVGPAIAAELASFDERAARTERLLAEADASSRNLEAALARLRASQARLEVLRGSLERSQASVRRLRAFLPL